MRIKLIHFSFNELISNLIDHNKIDTVMDDYELYFQNDAARMNQDLEQYQFFQHQQHSSQNILQEPISSDHTLPIPTLPTSTTDFNITKDKSFNSYSILSETLSIQPQDMFPKCFEPSSTTPRGLSKHKQPQKKKPIRKIKTKSQGSIRQDQYPTKNFLQNFKGAHMDYLKKFFSLEYLETFQIFQKLKGKNSMSRSIYQALYQTSQFEQVFRKMFASRYLYRAMMLSRSESTAKKNHSNKILVLEEAFYSKNFLKIN